MFRVTAYSADFSTEKQNFENDYLYISRNLRRVHICTFEHYVLILDAFLLFSKFCFSEEELPADAVRQNNLMQKVSTMMKFH